jgi:hypothetical protein
MTVYNFAIAVSTCTHVTALVVAISSPSFPTWLLPEYKEAFRPARVFLPRLSGRRRISTLVEGGIALVQWDETIAVMAFLLWSLYLLETVRLLKKMDKVRFAGEMLARLDITRSGNCQLGVIR